MPTKRPKRWGNPQRQIEADANIDLREQMYYKAPRKDLRAVGHERTRGIVKSLKKLEQDETHVLHYHQEREGAVNSARALPSDGDFTSIMRGQRDSYLERITEPTRKVLGQREPRTELYTVSRIGLDGKEKGRTHVHYTNKFRDTYWTHGKLNREGAKLNMELRDKMRMIQEVFERGQPDRARQAALEFYESLAEYGIRIRFLPMKGYRFDRKKCDFVKIKE